MDFYKICRKYLCVFSRENCVTSNSKEQVQSKGRKCCIKDGNHSENSLKENLSGCEGHRVSTEDRRKAICLSADFTGSGAALQSQTGSAS